MKIRILHPINHDHIYYDRGLYDLDEDLAMMFLQNMPSVCEIPTDLSISPEGMAYRKVEIKKAPEPKPLSNSVQ